MFVTKYGTFNGTTWEALCQIVFKLRYGDQGYQRIPASPGDFGLEGFTLKTGLGFQCYCPDRRHESAELYKLQRDKITIDLGKLRKNQKDIAACIGKTKIKEWHFVSPEIEHNKLLMHARVKEVEVRAWELDILDKDFSVQLRDAEFYLPQINQTLSLDGQTITFDSSPPALTEANESQEVYEANIDRKNRLRLSHKEQSSSYLNLVAKLNNLTLKEFLESDGMLRRIEQGAPEVYYRLVRLINTFESIVEEQSMTWDASAADLTAHIRDKLTERIANDLNPHLDITQASLLAKHIVSRWLAMCQLDFES